MRRLGYRFASKPAPTFDRSYLSNTVKCGSGLAREGNLTNATTLSGDSPNAGATTPDLPAASP